MAKDNKGNTSRSERTAKDHIKALGNSLLGAGETVLGVGAMVGAVAIVVTSFGTALLIPGGMELTGALFEGGVSLAGDGVNRVASPYEDKTKDKSQTLLTPNLNYNKTIGQAKEVTSAEPPLPTYDEIMGNSKSKPQVKTQTTQMVTEPPLPTYDEIMGNSKSKPQVKTQTTQPKEIDGAGLPQKSRGFLGEFVHKIKKNPLNTLIVLGAATLFPIGTIAAVAVVAGTVAKSYYDNDTKTAAYKASIQKHTPSKGHQTPPSKASSYSNNKTLSAPSTPKNFNKRQGHNGPGI